MSGNNVLTESRCRTAENLVPSIKSKAKEIRKFSSFFVSAMSRGDVASWLTDTDVGAETKQRILDNAKMFDRLADTIDKIAADTMELVERSRANNKA